MLIKEKEEKEEEEKKTTHCQVSLQPCKPSETLIAMLETGQPVQEIVLMKTHVQKSSGRVQVLMQWTSVEVCSQVKSKDSVIVDGVEELNEIKD